MTLNIMIQNRYGECFMNEKMKEEILDNWNSWKYDIIEMNTSTWNQRDQSKLDKITAILEEQLAWQKAANRR